MKKILEITKVILIFLLLLFIIFFSIMNSEIIKINFDFFPLNFILEIRIFLLIIFCFAIGFLTGIAVTSYSLLKKYFENVKYKKTVEKLEKDIKQIKNNEENKENE